MENDVTYEYPQGIWCIDEDNPNQALRVTGNKTVIIPLTKEVLEEIKKQIEASNLFRGFKQVDPEDENIIAYLNIIFDDSISRLDLDSLTALTNKMKQIEESKNIDIQNASYIQQIRTNIEQRIVLTINDQEKEENINVFETLKEQFQTYNALYDSQKETNSRAY